MVAYGWQSRKKNVKVADSSKNANETVEVNQSETSTDGEINAISESETDTTVLGQVHQDFWISWISTISRLVSLLQHSIWILNL